MSCVHLVLVACATWLGPQAVPAVDKPPLAAALERAGAQSVEELVAGFGKPPDAETAKAMLEVAQHLKQTGNLEQSHTILVEALRMRRALYGEADERTLFVIGRLTSTLPFLGRVAEALEIGAQAIRVADESGQVKPDTMLALLNNHSVNLQIAGRLLDAEHHMDRATELVLQTSGEASKEFAKCLFNRANIQRDLGRFRSALEIAEQALDLRRSHFAENSKEVMRVQLLLGALHTELGNLFDAELLLRGVEREMRSLEAPPAELRGDMLNLLGHLLLFKGDCESAEAALREAYTTTEATFGPQHPALASISTALATALFLTDRAHEAVDLLQPVIETSTQQYGAWNAMTIQARAVRALALGRMGDEQSAQLLRDELSILATNSEVPPDMKASVRTNLAACLVKAKDFEAAESELRTAIAEFEACSEPDSMYLIDSLARLALVQEERGDLPAAEETAVRASNIAASHGGNVLGSEIERLLFARQLGHGVTSRLLARLRIERGDLAGGLAAMEEARGRVLQQAVDRAQLESTDGISNEALAERERLLEREESARAQVRDLESQALMGSDATVDPQALQQRIAAARNALSAASAAVHLLSSSRAPAESSASLSEWRAHLRPDEALVSILWSDRLVCMLVVRPVGESDAPLASVLAKGESQVKALASRMERLLCPLSSDPRTRSELDMAELSTLVPEEVRTALSAFKRVYIVPDGPWCSVPFDLALASKNLAAVEAIVTPSTDVWLTLKKRASASAPTLAKHSKSVVLGDPDFGTRSVATTRLGSERARLPATRAEAEYVARVLEEAGQNVNLMLSQAANRTHLEGQLPGLDYLHLATHGFPGTSRAPLDAALALAEQTSGPQGLGNDALTLDRLVRRWNGKLRDCRLVVLSACETNREVEVGTGMYSLASGFLHAGAASVLASLWRIDDQATAMLMGRFYENLAGLRLAAADDAGAKPPLRFEPMTSAAALQEAKSWLSHATRDEVRETVKRMGLTAADATTRSGSAVTVEAVSTTQLRPYADPYFWAGFVLIGSGD